jgi:drug/metabolite transporter (DMT)-like permease
MLAAMTIFSLVNVFSKMMVAAYPPAQLFFIRGFGAIATLLPFLARIILPLRAMCKAGLQVLRMMLSVSDGMLFFTAIKYIPLADATTCYLAAPIFVTAFSAIFLREHVGWRRWSAVAAGFVGVLIALRPTGAAISWPALIALAGCLCQSIFMIVTRYVRGTSNIFLAATSGGIVCFRWHCIGFCLCAADVDSGGGVAAERRCQCCRGTLSQPFADSGTGQRGGAVPVHHDRVGNRARVSGVR